MLLLLPVNERDMPTRVWSPTYQNLCWGNTSSIRRSTKSLMKAWGRYVSNVASMVTYRISVRDMRFLWRCWMSSKLSLCLLQNTPMMSESGCWEVDLRTGSLQVGVLPPPPLPPKPLAWVHKPNQWLQGPSLRLSRNSRSI
ncbi:hypothetical protein LINGRAHAP2_LOCUS20419 [Linum grandiflorum]